MPMRICTCLWRWSFGAGLSRESEDDAMSWELCALPRASSTSYILFACACPHAIALEVSAW